jgi:ribose transport system substrate-binding protein
VFLQMPIEVLMRAKGERVPKTIDTGFKWYDKTIVDSPEMKPPLHD